MKKIIKITLIVTGAIGAGCAAYYLLTKKKYATGSFGNKSPDEEHRFSDKDEEQLFI